MKSLIRVILITLVILVIFSFGFCLGRATKQDTSRTFYATIESIDESTLLVKGVELNDLNFRGEFYIGIDSKTNFSWRGTDISVSDLETGDLVSIQFDGDVLESYPAQINSNDILNIILLDDEK